MAEFFNVQTLERGKPLLFCSPGSPLPMGSLAKSPGGCTSTDEEESFVTVTSLDRTRHRHLEDTFHSVVTSPQSEAAFKSVNQVWSLKLYSSIFLMGRNRRCFALRVEKSSDHTWFQSDIKHDNANVLPK